MNVQNVRKKRRQIIIITVHTHTQNKENNKQTIYSNKLYSNDDNIHQTRSLKTTQKHHNTHTHISLSCVRYCPANLRTTGSTATKQTGPRPHSFESALKSDSAGAAGLASSNSLAPKHSPANPGLPHQYTQILLSTHRTAQCPLQ